MSQEIKRLDQFRLQCRQFEVLGSGVLSSVLCSGFTVLAARGRERRTANLEPNPEPSTQNPEPRTPPHRNENASEVELPADLGVARCLQDDRAPPVRPVLSVDHVDAGAVEEIVNIQ